MKLLTRPPLLLVLLGLLFLSAGRSAAQCLDGWAYNAPVTITNSGGDLTDYLALIKLNTAALIGDGKMKNNGGDLRITDSDSCTLLTYWIESGLNTPTTTIWVKIPSIRSSVTKQIYLFYGNPAAPALPNDPVAIFGSGIVALYTFTEGEGSTLVDHVGEYDLSISSPDGMWGRGFRDGVSALQNFSGDNRAFLSGEGPLFGTGEFTALTFVNPTQLDGGSQGIIGNYNEDDPGGWVVKLQGAPGEMMNLTSDPENGWCQDPSHGSLVTDTWQMVGGSRSSSSKYLYQDGANIGEVCAGETPRNVDNGIGPLEVGSTYNGGSPFAGAISFVALYNVALSDDQVRSFYSSLYASPEPALTIEPEAENVPPIPPSITEQPVGGTLCVGEPITFTMAGTGNRFQWYHDGVAIGGATDSTYTINGVSIGDAGQYTVVVRGGAATVTSDPATLVVNTLPAITRNPTGTIGCPGQAVTFVAAATGTGITYQWRRNGVDIPGQTGTSYSIASTATTDAGSYDVVVTGICGTPAVSEAAQLRVNVPPVIIEQPRDTAICREQSFTLSTSAIGTDIRYQWRKEGVDIPGATGPTLTRSAQPYDAGTYDVVISGMCQPVAVSQSVVVAVTSEALLVEQPRTQQAIIGQSVTFRVKVDGGGSLSYQWQKDGVTIPGATQSFYTIPSVTLSDIADYNVVVRGSTCEQFQTVIVSDVASLVIDAPPEIGKQPESQTLCAGGSVLLSVGVTGTNLSYQWRKDGVPIPGATSRNYTIQNAGVEDAGSYDVVIHSPSSQVLTSAAAQVTVNPATAITEQPSNMVVCAGEPVTISVAASGNDLSYQWRRNGVALPAATSSSYVIAAASASDSGMYAVDILGSCGDTVASQSALVVVNTLPAVTTQPVALSLARGERAVFSVSAVGSELRYQWYRNGTAISGATNASYEIASVAESDEGMYSVVVSGVCAPSDSSVGARLTVDGVSSVPGESGTISGARLVVVPQPAHGMTRVTVELPAGMKVGSGVGLGLYDGSGRRVVDLSGSYAMSGYRSAEFDASVLSSGMYVCRLEGVAGNGSLGVVMVTK